MSWSFADLHVHTTCSDGRPTPERLAERLLRSRLAVVAVTDHDTIEGALRVAEALAGRGPEIVIGTEVTTADGHLLGLFVARDVPAGRSAAATVAAIHEQGGLAVAAHPYSLALGVGVLAARLPFDAVEVRNGSPLMELANGRPGGCAGAARRTSARPTPTWRRPSGASARRSPARARPTCGPRSWPG
ncbi:MAG TPA: PHP domain-containing protein [Candidatus Dormibacteraeota bacterium]|nr:PHP domain-containing protein [Candidatus Dormibacteraeota bacterium]